MMASMGISQCDKQCSSTSLLHLHKRGASEMQRNGHQSERLADAPITQGLHRGPYGLWITCDAQG